MFFRKIASNVRIESTSGGGIQEFPLQASPGGHTVKAVGYHIRIIQFSSNDAQVGLKLNHGPDGCANINHSTPISATTLSPTVTLLAGDTSQSTVMIGEWLHPILLCDSGAAQRDWAVVDVYEMRKPF